MARVIIKTAQGPFKIAAKDGDKFICMCGLSKNQPFCDKSHTKTLDEKADNLYQYDEAGKRDELNVENDDCCCGSDGNQECEEKCCGGSCKDEDCKDCCDDKDDCKSKADKKTCC